MLDQSEDQSEESDYKTNTMWGKFIISGIDAVNYAKPEQLVSTPSYIFKNICFCFVFRMKMPSVATLFLAPLNVVHKMSVEAVTKY